MRIWFRPPPRERAPLDGVARVSIVRSVQPQRILAEPSTLNTLVSPQHIVAKPNNTIAACALRRAMACCCASMCSTTHRRLAMKSIP